MVDENAAQASLRNFAIPSDASQPALLLMSPCGRTGRKLLRRRRAEKSLLIGAPRASAVPGSAVCAAQVHAVLPPPSERTCAFKPTIMQRRTETRTTLERLCTSRLQMMLSGSRQGNAFRRRAHAQKHTRTGCTGRAPSAWASIPAASASGSWPAHMPAMRNDTGVAGPFTQLAWPCLTQAVTEFRSRRCSAPWLWRR
jgi:hypothetical protein